MEIFIEEYNLYMGRHEYRDSHVSASSISASTSSKPSSVISIVQSSLFHGITKNLNLLIGTLIFYNGLNIRKCKSRDVADRIFKPKKVLREHKIPSIETIRGLIIYACYVTMMERQTRNLFTKSKKFGLSGSGDGTTASKKPWMNAIVYGTHYPVAVCDIYYLTGCIEG